MEYIFKCWYGSFNGENGKHIKDSEFGESNNKKLGFISPSSVACDGSYIYITDIERNDIQKINLTNLSCEVIGEEGNGNSQFMKPTDIKLLGSNMYVADSENVRMQIISKVSTFIEQQKPELEGMNASFLGLSMNSDYDSLYIVDAVDCSVSKFDVYGTFEKKIGSKGSGVGQLLNPSDVMLDKEDNIWVADTGNRRLVMFPSNGGEAKSIGSGGSGNGQFKSPQRLAHNSTGDIFVSDCDKNVVMRFDNSGKYLYSIGQSELNRPFGLAIDSSDNLYVCDTGNHRICKYDANNQFEGWFGLAVSQEAGGWHEASEKSNGASGSAPCQFTTPMYLDLDNDDALYVLDYGSKKIQKLDTKNTGVLGGHICSVEVDADMFGIVVDDKDCFFLTTDDFVRKYVPAP
ncbi:MAG: NHL repeat-containing protein [Candidatus Riflebacteria bacterium]|nr:NHL repeat-containing protein [Candidatus Riflebacteria bacterium]